jgi:hypothetical protein
MIDTYSGGGTLQFEGNNNGSTDATEAVVGGGTLQFEGNELC